MSGLYFLGGRLFRVENSTHPLRVPKWSKTSPLWKWHNNIGQTELNMWCWHWLDMFHSIAVRSLATQWWNMRNTIKQNADKLNIWPSHLLLPAWHCKAAAATVKCFVLCTFYWLLFCVLFMNEFSVVLNGHWTSRNEWSRTEPLFLVEKGRSCYIWVVYRVNLGKYLPKTPILVV